MSKKRKSKGKESVADLIARAKTNTLKVSVYNLKTKPYRPPSPKKLSSSMSVTSYEDDVSLSGYSVHSFDSGLSFSSFQSKSVANFELRNRIERVERKIRKHHNLAELPTLHVPPDLCAWDHRIPKKYRNRERPPVNIIPCHQPSDLIVARADERVRKQITAKESREKHMTELSQYIDHLIQLKLTRGERYAQLMEEQRRQSMLLKIICICNYMIRVSPEIEKYLEYKRETRAVDNAARYLQRGMSLWYEDRVSSRYTNFEKVIAKYKWRLQMVISIAQKRRASRIIRTYLTQRKDKKGQMSNIIHHFLKGVRRLQGMARSFIDCKIYRIRSMDKIWVDLEKQYILCTMAKKRAEVNQSTSTDMESLVIDTKTRIEMEKQNDRWDLTSKRFDRILDQHRARGDLDVSLEADGIDGMLIPAALRKRNLEELLREKRKEHVLILHDMQKQMNTSCQFSEEDALSFLKGDIQPGFRINLSDNAQAAIRVLCPFNLYKNLKDENFLDRIQAIHRERKTFEITPNNVHLFNAALQNQHKIQRNHLGEKVILRRSASINIRAYEEHDSILRARLTDAIDGLHKDKKMYGNGLKL